MYGIILTACLIFASVYLFFVCWKDRSPISVVRFIGTVISFLIIFALNLNWLFHRPIKVEYALVAVILLILISIAVKFKADPGGNVEKGKRVWIFFVSIFFVCFVLSYSYFEGDLAVPRYTTPDSAGHYLYMSRTAQSGVVPIYAPNEIYPASGFNEVFRHHHDTYFPGASVAFFFLSKLMGGVSVTVLQVFNILIYALTSVYFCLIFLRRRTFKSRIFFGLFVFMTILGSFLTLFISSYTNQLFSLLILLVFMDTFSEYYAKKMSIVVPMIVFSGLAASYFYWLPPAVMFMIFTMSREIRTMAKEKKYDGLLPVIYIIATAIVLNLGYILVSIKANVTGLSTEGQFKLIPMFFKNTAYVLPFSIVSGYILLKKKIKEDSDEYFVIDLALSSLAFSLMLLTGFYARKVAGYAVMKSFFLLVPIVWMLGIILFDWLWTGDKSLKSISPQTKSLVVGYFKKNLYGMAGVAVVITLVILILKDVPLKFFSIDFSIYPALSDNVDKVLERDKNTNIDSRQLAFLDRLKSDYPWALKDGRIMIIAPSDTALWVFAYSGIWPRTLTTVPKGDKNLGIYSPMSFYSRDILNYSQWLNNDREHILAVFDNEISKEWEDDNGFDIDNYDKVFSSGQNFLLSMKGDAKVKYYYDGIFSHDYFTHELNKDKKPVLVPFNGEFQSYGDAVDGISFQDVGIRQKDAGDYYFNLRNGKCNEQGNVVYEKHLTRSDFKGMKDGASLDFFFDDPVQNAKGKYFCYSLSVEKEYSKKSAAEEALIFKKSISSGNILEREVYIYQNQK